jgi:hypothetical protein
VRFEPQPRGDLRAESKRFSQRQTLKNIPRRVNLMEEHPEDEIS